MADEIAQVCQMEVQGVTLAIKGSVQMAKWFMKAITALIRNNKENSLNKSGAKSFKEILELSKRDGNLPQFVEIPEEYRVEALTTLRENGFHFAILPDFDTEDTNFQIAVPYGEFTLVCEMIKSYLHKKCEEDEKIISDYKEKEENLLGKIDNCDDTKEKEFNVTLLENYQQAKSEVENETKKYKEYQEKGFGGSFEEYLKKCKGTEFEKDPDKAITEYEKGVDVSKNVVAKECMQPIRSHKLMPKTKLKIYIPEQGCTITRNYAVDENTDIVFSEYSLKTKSGEIYEFTDKNITKEKWNSDVLPELLDKAGILEMTKCHICDSEEKYEAYIKYHNQITPKSEENINNRKEKGDEGFSSAEVKKEVNYAMEQDKKGKASAIYKTNVLEVEINVKDIIKQSGRLKIKVNDNELVSLPGVVLDGVNNGVASISIDKDTDISIERKDRTTGKSIVEKSSIDEIKAIFEKEKNITKINEKKHSEKRYGE